MGFRDRLAHGWNAFVNGGEKQSKAAESPGYYGGWGVRPDRTRMGVSNERSIVASIYTRLSIDCSGVDLRHAVQDDNGRYLRTVNSGLQYCLNTEANVDQGASAFRQDIYMTLFATGAIAIVPVDVDVDPTKTGGYDIKTLRVGRVVDWEPEEIQVSLYNEKLGKRQDIWVPKKLAAVVENPFHAVMNEPNSTLQRLIRKLNMLDAVDEAASSGSLDIIIQMPFSVKTDTKRKEADQRLQDIEMQLRGSKRGIAYADATEKITQLNRPTENNMLKQIEYLMNMLYSELGTTKEVFDGTADEATMLNYNNRTVEPIVRAVREAMARVFLTKTARSQGHTIFALRDPFKLVPISQMAEISDKLTRNEIASSNEMRAIFGWMPSSDPNADKLMNKNIPQAIEPGPEPSTELVEIKK